MKEVIRDERNEQAMLDIHYTSNVDVTILSKLLYAKQKWFDQLIFHSDFFKDFKNIFNVFS